MCVVCLPKIAPFVNIFAIKISQNCSYFLYLLLSGLQTCVGACGHFIIMETEMKIGAVKRVCNYNLFITPHERLKKQPLFRTLMVGLTTNFRQTASNDYSPLLEISGNVSHIFIHTTSQMTLAHLNKSIATIPPKNLLTICTTKNYLHPSKYFQTIPKM